MSTKLRNLILSIILFLGTLSVTAQSTIPKAQAMFIYNFSRLVEWPGASSGDFIIGVMGHDGVAGELANYTAGKKAGSQSIKVVEFNNPSDISKCNILFVGFGKTGKMGEIIAKVSSNGTLIISERKGSCEEGAAINFVVEQNSLKFEVKPGNATRYGLVMSSKLEQMALQVY